MPLFNRLQPVRPRTTEDGQPLYYRTHVIKPTKHFQPYSRASVIAQIQAYRWVRNEFVNGVAVVDLHRYLFYDYPEVSKRTLGMLLSQTVLYNPRKLKGKTSDNPIPIQTYYFGHPLELQYGLEWPICMWLWKVCLAKTPEEMIEFLQELASCEEQDIEGLYLEPVQSLFGLESMDWWSFWDKHNLTEETISMVKEKKPKPEPLRSYT